MPLYWIWLNELNHVTHWQKQRLLDTFGEPESVYLAGQDRLSQVAGMDEKAMKALRKKDLSQARQILAACKAADVRVVHCRQEGYPARLRNIEDPPVVLYYRGILPDWQAQPVIGVVGTRKASIYGTRTTGVITAQIAACGGLVITGGAEGIDTAALKAALDMDSPTVTVFGCGVDVVYPKKNQELFDRVLKKGCIISEYPPNTRADGWRFLKRNRLISGISNGVLVVEAPMRSGALNTAEHALTQGRDVYTVPGNLGVDSCMGSNLLLQRGAFAVMQGWDILRQYENLYPGKVKNVQPPTEKLEKLALEKVAQQPQIPGENPGQKEKTGKKSIDNLNKSTYSVVNEKLPRLTEAEEAVYALLSQQPQFPDEVLAQCELPFGRVQSILTKLTVLGLVVQHPGGQVSRK